MYVPDWVLSNEYYYPKFAPYGADIWVEDTEKQVISWVDVQRKLEHGQDPGRFTMFIEIEAEVTMLRFEWLERPPQNTFEHAPHPSCEPGLFVRCHDEYSVFSPFHPCPLVTRNDFTSKPWECVIIGTFYYPRGVS